jgi:hypothetical protein
VKPIEMILLVGIVALSFPYVAILAMITIRVYFDHKLRYHRILCEQLMEESTNGKVFRRE